MDALTLLAEARAAGLKVWAENHSIRVRGPRCLSHVVEKLAEHKAELMAILEGDTADHGFQTYAQRASALIATVEDDHLRVALRDCFEERAAIVEYEGGLPRDEAEQVALREVQTTLALWAGEATS